MAYAVIRTGGKQYRVEPGSVIRIEKLAGEVGTTVEFGEVLLAGGEALRIGTPLVEGVTVRGEILAQERDRKILVFKKKKRKGMERKRGHRQELSVIKINTITV